MIFAIFVLRIGKKCIFAFSSKCMDTVKINIELPNCGQYSQKELEKKIYSYALSLVNAHSPEMTETEELKELNCRLAEMENDRSVCIPHD